MFVELSKLPRTQVCRHGSDGYTLTEMLIVIVIIGLLAAAITPGIIGQLGRARARTAQMHLETVAAAIETYRADVGSYPMQSQGLAALITAPSDAPSWLGPYLRNRAAISDPWGRELIYSTDAQGSHFSVMSLGADGSEGGAGVNQDLTITTGP